MIYRRGVVTDQRALLRHAVADLRGVDGAGALLFNARFARRSAASRLRSACRFETAAICAARRWAELGHCFGGCTDTVTFCLAAMGYLLVRSSHASRSGRRSGCPSDRVDLLWSGGHPVVVRSGVVGRKSPARGAAFHDPYLTRLAHAPSNCVLSASWSWSLLVPLSSPRRRRVRAPCAVNQIETRPPSRWGNALRSTAPAPQSKPVAHASRLVARVAPSVAFGPGVRILAAGPAPLRLYSDFRRCGQ